MYLNRVELIGFLGSEPEAAVTSTGRAVTSLSLATKASWIKGDERQKRTEWHGIQAWGKLSEYAAGFRKGAHVPSTENCARASTRPGGTKVRTYEIVAASIINLRSGQRNNARDTDPDQASAGPDDDTAA